MSRILRRPMFRGGRAVSSYGNGIATGLAMGGRVGLQGGGAPPLSGFALNQGTTGANIAQNAQNVGRIRGGLNTLRTGATSFLQNPNIEQGLYNIGKRIIGTGGNFLRTAGSRLAVANPITMSVAGVVGPQYALAKMSEPKTVEALAYMKEMSSAGVMDETAGVDDFQEYAEEFARLNDTTKFTPLETAEVGLTTNQEELDKIVNEQRIKRNKETEEAETNPGLEINVNSETGEPTETVTDKKTRLKKAAKEYEEILGEGIKKNSIFDAMIAGGAAATAGGSLSDIITTASKKLDPIQNVKTAAKKLAVEEDIALRRAKAIAATKKTATSDMIELGRKTDPTSKKIYKDLVKNKAKGADDYIKNSGGSAVTGLALFAREELGATIIDKKTDTTKLKDGKYYIPEEFLLITVEEGKITDKDRLK